MNVRELQEALDALPQELDLLQVYVRTKRDRYVPVYALRPDSVRAIVEVLVDE